MLPEVMLYVYSEAFIRNPVTSTPNLPTIPAGLIQTLSRIEFGIKPTASWINLSVILRNRCEQTELDGTGNSQVINQR